MKKDFASVKAIIENTIEPEEGADEFPVDEMARAYLEGTPFTPANESQEELAAYSLESLQFEYERYKPTPDEEWQAAAEKIPVTIGNRSFETYIDKNGVQRFVTNSVIYDLMERMLKQNAPLDLNELFLNHARGRYSNDDWLTFLTSSGYSFYGLVNMNDFSHLPITNPLWDKPKESSTDNSPS